MGHIKKTLSVTALESFIILCPQKVFVFTCYYRNYLAQTGDSNGTLLQYSSLENPMDRGAW